MKGLIKKAVLALACGGAMAGAQGCTHYRCLVDPCYPERYNYMARESTEANFLTQINNGRVLDQTVWNYHFEEGGEKLTPGGLDHLAYLARRRPSPDAVIYLQTAQDLPYDPKAPGKLIEARSSLDAKRTEAIQAYLNAQVAGRPVSFQVVVHDPPRTGQASTAAGGQVRGMYGAVQGSLGGGPGGIGTGAGVIGVGNGLGGGAINIGGPGAAGVGGGR